MGLSLAAVRATGQSEDKHVSILRRCTRIQGPGVKFNTSKSGNERGRAAGKEMVVPPTRLGGGGTGLTVPSTRSQVSLGRAPAHLSQSCHTHQVDICEGACCGPPFASSCSSSILVQWEDRGGPSFPGSPGCTPLLPYLRPQVSPHLSVYLWLPAWGAKAGSVEDAQGRRLPLALFPGFGSSSSPAELETGRWGLLGK